MYSNYQGAPIQLDGRYWRQNPYAGEEVLYQIPDFPQRFDNVRDPIERIARDQLQQGAQLNLLRTYLYNQMSYNNYANDNWFAMIASIGQLLEVDLVAYGVPVNDATIRDTVKRVIEMFLCGAYLREPQFQNWLSVQEKNALAPLLRERDQIIQAVETFYARMSQPQYQQASYGNQNRQYDQLAGQQGGWGNQGGYQQPQQRGGDLGMRRTPSLEPAPQSNPAMRDAYEIAANRLVENTYGRNGSMDVRRPGGGGSDLSRVTSKPKDQFGNVESLTISPTDGVTYQRGGDTVNFEDYFEARDPRQHQQPDAPMAVPNAGVSVSDSGRFAMIDVAGIPRPIVYNRFTHRITENGEIVMQYENHELDKSLLVPEASVRTLPIYPNAQDIPENQTEARPDVAYLDDSKVLRLSEPLYNMELDTAFQSVVFTSSADIKNQVVHFVHMSTDSVLVGDRDQFFKEFADLCVGSQEYDITNILNLLERTEAYGYGLFRKLDRRATEAVNEVLSKQLGLKGLKIESFVEDFRELPAYLSSNPNYGPSWVSRLENALGTIHTAICCILTEEFANTVVDRNAVAICHTDPSGLLWNPETKMYRIPTREELDAISERKQAVEEEVGILDGLVQLVSTDYCVLVPTLLQNLGLKLEKNEATMIVPSVTPELADFVNGIVDSIGESHSFRRILLGTPDGAVLQLHPTPGLDSDNRQLWAVELLLK